MPAPSVTDLEVTFRAMACDVQVRILGTPRGAHATAARAQHVFAEVEAQCSRFDPDSDLSRANAAPAAWTQVGGRLVAALREADDAHRSTGGLFDPRILRSLAALGYERSLRFSAGVIRVDGTAPVMPTLGAWEPEFDGDRVRLGRSADDAVDLGGIGKGLAIRWAGAELAVTGAPFLVNAGGDCYLSGAGPDDGAWNVGVEDPRGGTEPVAVLRLADLACATSSIRLRRWVADGRAVHHLIDPRTGAPGGPGLLAVTVVGADPADAEVWSKVLFLHGQSDIGGIAAEREIAALWVGDDGVVQASETMRRYVIWTAA